MKCFNFNVFILIVVCYMAKNLIKTRFKWQITNHLTVYRDIAGAPTLYNHEIISVLLQPQRFQ